MGETPLRRLIRCIREKDRAVWVFCGDSITHGARHTCGRRGYVELVEERVRYEMQKFLHLFVNSGISRDTTAGILETIDHRVLRFQPDIFSLMIGMNDAARVPFEEYCRNLRRIVEEVRARTPAQVLLQTCCAIHPEQCPDRKRYPEYMEAMRQAAADLDAALIDHHSSWEKVRRDNPARFESWMANPIHPNALGHWVFADRILRDLELGPLQHVGPPPPETAP